MYCIQIGRPLCRIHTRPSYRLCKFKYSTFSTCDMASSQTSLRDFVEASRKQVMLLGQDEQARQTTVLVMGNESCGEL